MNRFEGNIALVTSAHVADFNVALCAHLKKVTGRKVILYVQGRESVDRHRKFAERRDVDAVVDCGLFYAFAKNAGNDEQAIIERARKLEKWIGLRYGWLLMSRREAGRGFALAGPYHPHSPFTRSVTHVQLLHGTSEMLEFWRREIAERNIGLVLNGSKEAAVICRAMGVAFREMYATRYRSMYYWAYDEMVAPPGLEKAYAEVGDGPRSPIVLEEPYRHETETRKLLVGNNGFPRFLRFTWLQLKRQAYLRVKGYRTENTYFFKDMVQYYWKYYRDSEYLTPPRTVSLKNIADRPFVFFPMQTEPEYSMQTMSPECFCQLGVIASLARDLPSGVILAVKETIWGVGRRPRDFYRQIKEFTNVVLLDVEERGLEVVKKAAAVATITGSAGVEAALQGRPVILFGRHNGFEFLPHVSLVTREEDLVPALTRIFDGSLNPAEAVDAGSRYGEALEKISFTMDGFAAFKQDGWSMDHVQTAVDALLNDLDAYGAAHGDALAAAFEVI
jgi:hypothetical protein